MQRENSERKKIVIYGFGRWGKEYWRQMQLEDNIEVLFFVDKRYNEYEDTQYPIYSPDILCQDIEYDYVLISVQNKELAKELEKRLRCMGIDKSQIIYPDKTNWKDEIFCEEQSLNALLKNEISLHGVLERYKKHGGGSKSFFKNFIEDMKLVDDKNRISEMFLDKMNQENLTAMDEIISIVLLFSANILTQPLLIRFMSDLKLLTETNRDDLYVFLSDVGHWIVRHPEGLYDDFYSDRKYLMRKTCEFHRLKTKIITNHEVSKKVRRIVITVYQLRLSKEMIGIDGIACQMANELIRQGYEVAIVVTGTFENWDISSCITPFFFEDVSSNEFKINNNQYLDRKIEVFYRNEMGIENRLQGCIDDIENFNPDVIFDFADSQWVSAALLNEQYPILRFPMRSNSFDTYFEKTIVYGKKTSFNWAKELGLISDEQLIELTGYGFSNQYFDQPSGIIYDKKELGFKETDFIVVTVGGRLYDEVGDDIGLLMKKFLDKYENIVWLLVGEHPALSKKLYDSLIENRRIYYWGFEKNLNALLKCCDVYLNPKRRGGGLSIKMAMSLGKPVAILNIPSDGSEILGERNLINGDYSDLVDYIECLYCDKQLYNEVSQNMLDRIAELYSPESTSEIIEAFQTCYNEFVTRRKL